MDTPTPVQSDTSTSTWTEANLGTQGYDLAALKRRRGLSVGLRFTTGLCLGLVVAALVLQSVPMLLVLSGIGAVAGFALRHPFDIWNRALRYPLKADALPPNPNPPRRKHSFKVASFWVLGVALASVCALATTTNLCRLSVMMKGFKNVQRPLSGPGEVS